MKTYKLCKIFLQEEEFSEHLSRSRVGVSEAPREVEKKNYGQASTPVAQTIKNPSANAGDSGSIPELGRSPGGGNGKPLHYYCLENSMDRGAWWATVHGVTKSPTRLK